MTQGRLTREGAKAEAKALRAAATDKGQHLTQGAALEMVARTHGFRDWNTLCAALDIQPGHRRRTGDRVSGRYLGSPFEGTIRSVTPMAEGWVRLSIEFDTPIDVVAYDSFSNLRRRINTEIGPKGHSRARTSDGVPHLILDL